MNDFLIERDIPAPSRRAGGRNKYPFRQMEVGDSFFVSNDCADANVIRAAASDAGRRMGLRFTVAKGGGGFRVWRTA